MAGNEPTSNPKLAQWAAAATLAAYAIVLAWLGTHLSMTDANWSRAQFLLKGAEAIVFAGAGWLWGTQVARGAVQATEKHVQAISNDLDNKTAEIAEARNVLNQQAEELGRAKVCVRAAHTFAGGGTAAEPAGDRGTGAAAQPGTASPPAPAALRSLLEQSFPEAFQDN